MFTHILQTDKFVSTEDEEEEIDDDGGPLTDTSNLDVHTQLQLIWKSITKLQMEVEDIKVSLHKLLFFLNMMSQITSDANVGKNKNKLPDCRRTLKMWTKKLIT